MDCKDEMVEMEPQEAKGRRETLVCRDHLAFKVHKLTECHHNKYSGKPHNADHCCVPGIQRRLYFGGFR